MNFEKQRRNPKSLKRVGTILNHFIMKKLSLKKEKIAILNDQQLQEVNGGGGTVQSTVRQFTCCWCIKIGGSGTTRDGGTEPTIINPGG